MSIQLERQIERVRKMVLELGWVVEQAVQDSIRSVKNRDPDLARKVIAQDEQVDRMEVDLEEECLHTLALYQPVAFDLRYVVAVLKVNNDLERIADQAANIAEQAIYLTQEPPVLAEPFDMEFMSQKVCEMLRKTLEALIRVDQEQAERIIGDDERIDTMHRHMYENVETAMRENPENVSQFISFMNVSRQLERIADLAVNIAEDVIYMSNGRIARHGARHRRVQSAS